jgi:hypothetical protein
MFLLLRHEPILVIDRAFLLAFFDLACESRVMVPPIQRSMEFSFKCMSSVGIGTVLKLRQRKEASWQFPVSTFDEQQRVIWMKGPHVVVLAPIPVKFRRLDH